MADIRLFYEYIRQQVQTGTVQLLREGEFGIPRILERFSLEQISLEMPELSSLEMNGFRLNGIMNEGGRSYACTLTVTAAAEDYDCLFQAKLRQNGDMLLNEVYPPALAYITLNFYSRPVNLFEQVWLKEAVIAADTIEKTEVPLFSMTIYYGEDCPLYKNYGDFLPEAGEMIVLEGDAREPFGETKYVVEGAFLKQIELPFYGEIKTAKECRLVVNSHVTGDGWEENGETLYQCRVGVKFCVPVSGISEQGVWMSIDFGSYGESYNLYVNFDEGMSLGNAAEFIASMTGKSSLPDFPEWTSFGNTPLVGIMMTVERAQSVELWKMDPAEDGLFSQGLLRTQNGDRLMGCAFYFALNLPDIPIPFFDRAQGGAKAELTVQWNMLNIGGFLAIVAGFHGVWKNHDLIVNITVPDLEIKGIYEQEMGKEISNGIFPGFMDLTVRYIRLHGYLLEKAYELDFELVNRNLPVIPMGAHFFQIDTVTGRAEYSPKGLELAVTLEFTLLTAILQLEGIYDRGEEGQTLTLRGGLARPFRLSELIALITGEEAAKNSLDFVVNQLSVTYQTALSGESGSGNSLGTPLYFEFLCAIAFEWGDQNQIASSFHLQWEKDVYRFWITAGITLFECFAFAASCQVLIEGGEASFQDFQFMTKIRNIEMTATYDKQKNFSFLIRNFNLGELIEGLISLIAPDHNWYLPWPFTILKQITLKELEVVMDRQKETIRARYKINLKILFLTVECIELFYDYGNEDFWINVITNASIGERDAVQQNRAGQENDPGQEDENLSGQENDEGETYGLNLLKDIFPLIKGAGDRLFSLKYLGIGQHIQVEIPESFEETAFPQVLENMKKSIRKSGRPGLDMNHNWVAALQLKLINAIDLTLLMCDPVFYGLQVDIGKGSDLVEQLAGLSFTILYSKVTENIGMFYARLKFPEAFRRIELGAVQIFLGEIGVWIYTNGNFKIDMGFPHNGDFSNSFGLTYLFFTGKGGFYFGLLNGDTSKAVPQVSRGHFEVVVELGIGISAGVGREISAGPLKAGAYVMVTAIFEGVFANYVPDREGQKDSVYYKVKALAGVTASVYGSVDFVLIQIGFSANLAFSAELVLESYQPTELSVHLALSVKAYIKILFIKISFDFSFIWNDKFVLGKKTIAPWEADVNGRLAGPEGKIPSYEMHWYDGAVTEEKQELCAEIIYYVTFDEPELGKALSGKRKIAFLSLLHGMTEETCLKMGYQGGSDTPFARLAEICFRRAVLSVMIEGEAGQQMVSKAEQHFISSEGQNEPAVNRQILEYLLEYLSRTESFEEGFSFEELNRFLARNVIFSYIKSSGMEEAGKDGQIDGIPFPLWPKMELTWFSAPDTTVTSDLETEPLVGEHFFADMQDYYRQLAMWNLSADMRLYGKNRETEGTSVSEFLFAQYFYMLTKIVVSLARDQIGEAELNLEQAVELIVDAETLEKAAGMISRFSYGGSRAYVNGEGTRSMYDFAGQELAGLNPEVFSDTDVIHRMSIKIKEEEESDARNFLPQMPEIGLYRRAFGETVLRGRSRWDGADGNDLEWSFTKADLVYPGGALQMSHEPKQMPFYRRQPKTLELKNPQGLLGQAAVSFWEMQSRTGGNFQIITYENGEPLEHPFERGVLLRIPIKANQNDIFEIEPPGYEAIDKLTAILQGQALSITPYRYTNELDSDHCGFAGLDENMFLYRHNLCLEAEKPQLRRYGARAADEEIKENVYENSAWLTETTQFLSLLKDAAMVNARGYYVKFHLEERQILQDGRMTLVLWVRTEELADDIKIIHEGINKESHPVLLTEEEISVYAYQPGTFAFSLEAEENGSEIQEQYQMLGYQIQENEFFKASNESRPVIAQEMGDLSGNDPVVRDIGHVSMGAASQNMEIDSSCAASQDRDHVSGYSQIVPAYCFAKGDGESPYGGIAPGSSLKMDFRLIDLLGNRSASGITWEIPYGYTDPLLPVSVYPHTKCAFELERSEEGYVCVVTFTYVEETGQNLSEDESEKSSENLRLACHQLACQDVQCFIDLCGTQIQVEKAPLLAYAQGLCRGEKPETVVYKLPFTGGDEIQELKAAFILKREEQLLSDLLKESKEAAEVLAAKSDITENGEKINRDYLAVRGLDGQLFYVPPVKHAFDGYEIWTLRPLSNKLLQLTEIPVVDETGTTRRISYYDVDLEEWAADFLTDLEGFLKPDSIYGEDREICETLLGVKKNLAQVIASGVTKISGNDVGNPQFEDAAASCYQNLLLQNLSAGREMDGVILLQSQQTADTGKAWCFRAESDRDGFTLKPGKIRTDGILPVGVCAADVSKQMHMDMNLRLTFTDWEIAGEYFYDFLTVQEQSFVVQNIKGNLPYKRFPQMPVLQSQEYDGGKADYERNGKENSGRSGDSIYRWTYQVSFAHQTAEQDIVTLRLLPKNDGRLRNADDRFLFDMAQYRYLREHLLADTGLKKQLIECCRNICASWSYERMSVRAGAVSGEQKIRFSLSFEEKKLVILESDIVSEKLEISMKTSDGKYCKLNRGEGNFYILPEELAEPYEFLVSIEDLDIREVNRINTCISVTRNQEIAEKNDMFLYRSEEAMFADDLLPSLFRPEMTDLGSFEQENFVTMICGLCDGFGKASMEVYCKVPVSVYGEEVIYSSLPVVYVPDIAADGRNEMITQIYHRIEAWMKERFDGREGEMVVLVQMALFSAEEVERNLVEMTDLEFSK